MNVIYERVWIQNAQGRVSSAFRPVVDGVPSVDYPGSTLLSQQDGEAAIAAQDAADAQILADTEAAAAGADASLRAAQRDAIADALDASGPQINHVEGVAIADAIMDAIFGGS